MKQIKSPQTKFLARFLKDQPKAYGGDLLKTRKGRSHGRPLDTKNTMHLVLRSSKATGDWAFWRAQNKEKIRQIVSKFSHKYGIKVISMANVGNHLHLQIKLGNRFTFKPFIRAVTSAIAMAVTGANRWSTLKEKTDERNEKGGLNFHVDQKSRFWDYRPFTRVIQGYKAFLNLREYIRINQLEGFGFQRKQARFFLAWHNLKASADTC